MAIFTKVKSFISLFGTAIGFMDGLRLLNPFSYFNKDEFVPIDSDTPYVKDTVLGWLEVTFFPVIFMFTIFFYIFVDKEKSDFEILNEIFLQCPEDLTGLSEHFQSIVKLHLLDRILIYLFMLTLSFISALIWLFTFIPMTYMLCRKIDFKEDDVSEE